MGVVINPATPAAVLEEILPEVDLVVVMTVDPGFGHQHFLRSTLPKIKRVREMIESLHLRCEVEVDGGVDRGNCAFSLRSRGRCLCRWFVGFRRDRRGGRFHEPTAYCHCGCQPHRPHVTKRPAIAPPRTRVPHIPDFLWSSVGSANFMRLSLKKGAQVVLSGAACRKFGVSRSFFARCGGRPLVAPLPLGRMPVAVQWNPISRKTSEIWGNPGSWQGKILNPIARSRKGIVNEVTLVKKGSLKSSTHAMLSDVDPTAAPIARHPTWAQAEGSPLPLGVTWIEEEQAFNFAVHSEHAESVTLLLYSATDFVNPHLTFHFDFLRNKSGRVWHCRIPVTEIGEARYYAYSVSGNGQLHSFDPQKVLLDPYAKCIFFPPQFDREMATREGSNAGRAPLGALAGHRCTYDWSGDRPVHHESDAVIYELHVKGFTRSSSSGVDPSRAGTYAGLVEKIPYLKELGITIVELMPVFQRDPQEGDYWGYMPLNFFAPHAGYASSRDDDEQHLEFRNMVKAFHQAGIGVVLDVVYNHTCEGDQRGPIYSYKGFDRAGYYMCSPDPESPTRITPVPAIP